jgi:hypothetical protein
MMGLVAAACMGLSLIPHTFSSSLKGACSMKRLVLAVAMLGSTAAMLTGCYSAPVKPPVGYIYSEYKAPLDADFDQTKVSMKPGTAESISILGLFAQGDCSAQAAAAQGGIKTIHGADYTFFNVLGVYQRFTTVVYGE